MWQRISSGETWNGVIQNVAKDGKYYFVKTIISPLFQDGKIINYLSIRFDLTDYMRAKVERDKALEILGETSAIAKVGGQQ
jgi:aerotaxis receptor